MSESLLWREPACDRRQSMWQHVRRRRGMSLLEVMLASTILVGSVMVLSRMAFLARRHAEGAEDRTGAQICCQNIMEEILAGARPLQDVSPELLDGGTWMYTVEVESTETGDLKRVVVTVDRAGEEEEGTLPSEDEIGGYRLVRWVRQGPHGQETGLGTLWGDADRGFTEQIDGRLDTDGDMESVPGRLESRRGQGFRLPAEQPQLQPGPEPETERNAPPEF